MLAATLPGYEESSGRFVLVREENTNTIRKIRAARAGAIEGSGYANYPALGGQLC